MTKKPFRRAVGSGLPPADPPVKPPREAARRPAGVNAQASPDDLGAHAGAYQTDAEYVPLVVFLLGVPADRRLGLQDLRTEGMRAATETIRRGLPVKKLPHPQHGAVLCYPRSVLEALYLKIPEPVADPGLETPGGG